RGDFPVERGFNREPVDLRIHTLFRNLQGMEVNRKRYFHRFGADVYEEHAPVWQALLEIGWCSCTNETIRLLGGGVYYVPLIQMLLSRPRMDQLRAGMTHSPAATAAAT